MTVDHDTVFHQRKARMAFNEMRNIVVHMDYETYVNRGRKFNKLFKDEGNTLGIYLTNNEGVEFNSKGSLLNIYLQDAYGNLSILETKVNHRKIVNRPEPTFRSFLQRRNWLHLQSSIGDSAEVVLNNDTIRLAPYTELKRQFYLWDLRKGLPTQYMTSTDTLNFQFQQTTGWVVRHRAVHRTHGQWPWAAPGCPEILWNGLPLHRHPGLPKWKSPHWAWFHFHL